ncbi:uncharacterized protein LOC129754759 isoform X2 [Uranotaenia lowii]|uniref:uncharacterized protein LOC129754759 isoform X2 n=1 Tax=Uranotaenia lowii TaxID=190385 RepID=UPI00247A2E84|nr:uncharacterized protein LOC129754759 isoform X2 [Uranotaenia lowii]
MNNLSVISESHLETEPEPSISRFPSIPETDPQPGVAHVRICERCGGPDARHVCSDAACLKRYCKRCITQYSEVGEVICCKKLRVRNVRIFTNVGPAFRQLRYMVLKNQQAPQCCWLHPEELYKMFCMECEMGVCVVCAFKKDGDHVDHKEDILLLDDAFAKLKPALRDLRSRIRHYNKAIKICLDRYIEGSAEKRAELRETLINHKDVLHSYYVKAETILIAEIKTADIVLQASVIVGSGDKFIRELLKIKQIKVVQEDLNQTDLVMAFMHSRTFFSKCL